jgi:pimeloyl-ACP methyl ester carboxylesterase
LHFSDVGVLATGHEGGEAIVFVHGWGACKELWWNTQIGLADLGRSYSVDMPGTGDTPLGHRYESMSQLALWLHGVCKRLNVSQATLIGHSLGGNLVAQTALDHPDLVKRLILVDAALATESLPRRVFWTQSPMYGIHAIRAAKAAAVPLATAGLRVPHNHRGGFWGPFARRAGLFISANKSDAALQMQLKLLCANPLSAERLARIDAPILIVHGGLDGVIPVHTAKAYAQAIPGSRIKLFPTSHHCPMDHDPPGFVETLRDFIAETA